MNSSISETASESVPVLMTSLVPSTGAKAAAASCCSRWPRFRFGVVTAAWLLPPSRSCESLSKSCVYSAATLDGSCSRATTDLGEEGGTPPIIAWFFFFCCCCPPKTGEERGLLCCLLITSTLFAAESRDSFIACWMDVYSCSFSSKEAQIDSRDLELWLDMIWAISFAVCLRVSV